MKIDRVSPNAYNSQKIHDKTQPCDHLTIANQVGFALQPLSLDLQSKSFCITFCPICLQRIRVSMDGQSRPQVSELNE